ncbi:MAG: MFS transporter [Erysipelotrichaceae bacterium]|nr:MFS transporter [Erysipelotrichaceae bacterium]
MKSKLTKLEKYWILYDVGNSAFILMVSAIIPIFFKNLATSAGVSSSDSTAFWSYGLSISTLFVALIGTLLGKRADGKDKKKKYFTVFMIFGCLACGFLGFLNSWQLFLLVFIIAKIGCSGSIIFYDSMLTDITTDERSDVVSSGGYAWGYIGSCIPFVFSLILILNAKSFGLTAGLAGGISFIIIAIWWLLSSLPLIKNYKQLHYSDVIYKRSFSEIIKGVKETLSKIKENKPLWIFMLSYFFYIDGVYTIIELATSYGKDVGIGDNDLLLALLLTQVVAFPFALIFGYLSKKIKTRKLIEICVFGYILIVLFSLQLDKAWEFWFLAVCVAVFQGAIQSLSRSYFSRLVPKNNSNEFFGVFDIFGKGAAFTGTLIIGVLTQMSGQTKIGLAALIVLLVVGLILLRSVPDNSADI